MDFHSQTWLTQEQQIIADHFTQELENNSVLSETFWVSLVCNKILGRIFLLPEEIEEIIIGNDTLISTDLLRKLHIFRYYFWDKIQEIETTISDDEIFRTLKLLLGSQIISIFNEANFIMFQNSTRKFVVYFLAIEAWYHNKTWQELSFKWLEIPTEYDDWLWM